MAATTNDVVKIFFIIEKFYWLEFNTDISQWIICADKYKVREYIEAKCGKRYLNDLYFKWDNVDQINWSDLPAKCIIKTNHGSGKVFIINDKNDLDINFLSKELKGYLNLSYGYTNAQIHYTRIKPCIICEKLLEEHSSVSTKSLIDYKIWCFNGEPESIWVAYDRTDKNVKMALFDTKWNPIPEYLNSTDHYVYCPDDKIPKPICLDEMLVFARNVSEPFKEVRVDMYVIDGRPIFGELTFTTGYGYFTRHYYEYIGSKVLLQNTEAIKKNKLQFFI